jgi:O-antigen/teichoic acid export membrane protein
MSQIGHLFGGAVWNISGKLFQFALSLIALSVIARFIGPHAYGVFSLAWVAVGLIDIVVTSAPTDTLVQRREVTPGHLNASFSATVPLALLAVAALAVGAGTVGRWLNGGPDFMMLLPLRAATLPLSAAAAVPTALLMRQSRFKALAGAESAAGVLASITGLSLALAGAGIWSLLAMEWVRSLTLTSVVFYLTRWRPGRPTRRSDYTDLLGFNASTWAAWGLSYVDEQLPRAMIGATLGPQVLGYYALADRLFGQLSIVLMVPAYQVVSAGVARVQDNLVAVRRLMLATLKLAALAACPLFLGLSAVAPLLVPTVFGQAWVEAIVPVQILMLSGIRSSISMLQVATIRSMGKPTWHVAVGAIGVAYTVALVTLGLRWGLAGVATAVVLKGFAVSPLYAMLVRRLATIRMAEQYGAVTRPLLGAVPMAGCVWLASGWLAAHLGPVPALVVCGVMGAALYWLFLRLFAPSAARIGEQVVMAVVRRDISVLRTLLDGKPPAAPAGEPSTTR